MKLKTILATTLLAGSLFGISYSADASMVSYTQSRARDIISVDDYSLRYVNQGDITRGAVWIYVNGDAKILNFQYIRSTNTLRLRVQNEDWKYVNRYIDDSSIYYKYGSLLALKLAEKNVISFGIPLDKFYEFK